MNDTLLIVLIVLMAARFAWDRKVYRELKEDNEKPAGIRIIVSERKGDGE